jgi:hypothetical protein
MIPGNSGTIFELEPFRPSDSKQKDCFFQRYLKLSVLKGRETKFLYLELLLLKKACHIDEKFQQVLYEKSGG